MMAALMNAARACADVFSAPADGNSISDGAWVIDGESFRQTIGGNDAFGAAARANTAARLLPTVRRELSARHTPGSDVLGALLRVEIAMRSVPANRAVNVILLTDGALVVRGEYSMYATPLDTPARRRRFIARLAAIGELPEFDRRVTFTWAASGSA